MTTVADTSKITATAAFNGWPAKAEYAVLSPGSNVMVVCHKTKKIVRVVLNENATPEQLAHGMFTAVVDVLCKVGIDAATAAAEAVARILGDHLDDVGDILRQAADLIGGDAA